MQCSSSFASAQALLQPAAHRHLAQHERELGQAACMRPCWSLGCVAEP